MLNTTNAAIEYPNREVCEKRVPFNELMQAQTEVLVKTEANANRILSLLDKGQQCDDPQMSEIPDFRTAIQINLERSHWIADKLELIRAILEG